MLEGSQAEDTLAKIKVVVLDNDDCRTRAISPDPARYFAAVLDALNHCGPTGGPVTMQTWEPLHREYWYAGHCIYDMAAGRFDVNAHHMFSHFNRALSPDAFVHDTDSTAAINALHGNILVCSDASTDWTRASLRRGGVSDDIPTFCRDHGGIWWPLKSNKNLQRQRMAQRFASNLLGENVEPEEMLWIDDSSGALRAVTAFGSVALHNHWGHNHPGQPARAHSDEFDFNADHLGTWLTRHAPQLPNFPGLRELAAKPA